MADLNDAVLDRAHLRVGLLLKGKYRIERVIGIGGVAVVYAAKHRNNAMFAIKMLHPEISVRPEMRERFVREGYIANSVGHSGAVAVVDDDVADDGSAFLVMELLRGMSVDALCRAFGRRLPIPACVAIAYQLLDVLAAAHANGIIHRDIKPANLFATQEGALKVLDFGIARLRDAATNHVTSAGAVMGTPAFMAPEQAMGRTHEIGPASDIWAVGATMFSMLSGEPVHSGATSQQTCLIAATELARPISMLMPTLPREIARIVDLALSFDQDDRWSSASMMRDALRVAYAASYGPLHDREVVAALQRPNAARTLPSLQADFALAAATSRTPSAVVESRTTSSILPPRFSPSTAPPIAASRESLIPAGLSRRSGISFVMAGAAVLGAALGGALIALRPAVTSMAQPAASPRITAAPEPMVVLPPPRRVAVPPLTELPIPSPVAVPLVAPTPPTLAVTEARPAPSSAPSVAPSNEPAIALLRTTLASVAPPPATAPSAEVPEVASAAPAPSAAPASSANPYLDFPY